MHVLAFQKKSTEFVIKLKNILKQNL